MKITWIRLTTLIFILALTLHSSLGIGDEPVDDYDDTHIDDTEDGGSSDEAPAGLTSGQHPLQQTALPPQSQVTKLQNSKLSTTTKKLDVEVEVEEEYDDVQSEPVEEPVEDEEEPIDDVADGSEEIDDNDENGNGNVDDEAETDKSNENADEKLIKELSASSQTPEYKYTNGMNTYSRSHLISILKKPGILAGIIGGIVIGLLTAILLIMFVVYRMRKKDEGSYALAEDTKKPLSSYEYRNVPTKEFYA